jgi:probable rRNA maturation factor
MNTPSADDLSSSPVAAGRERAEEGRLEVEVLAEAPEAWPEDAGLLAETVRRAAAATLRHVAGGTAGPFAVSVTLAGNETVQALNRQWRGKDRPTNVLSFPAPAELPLPAGEPRPLGDLILAGPVVAREAAEAGVPLTEHLAYLVIHGMLHLLGYDHQREDERRRMEAAEAEILRALGHDSPYD